MILLYINNMISCCQSLNGLEQIDADVIILDGNNVETELTTLQTDVNLAESNITTLQTDVNEAESNITTLQTTATSLQAQINALTAQITDAGGYFVLTAEFNGNSTNAGFFSFGAGVNNGGLRAVLPNCTCIASRAECVSAVAAAGSIVFQKNGIAVNNLGLNFSTGNTLLQNLDRNTTFVLGDVINIRFNNTGSAMGGTAWRLTYIFQTGAISGTNGTDGQSVSFNVPTITTRLPNQVATITDTITTEANLQTHQLAFGIPRGKSITGSLGSVSSGTAAVSTTITTNANGDDNIAFNFVLQAGQNGAQGAQGAKGDKGDNGSADPITIAVATSAGAAAGGAAGGTAGGIAGASAGSSAGASSGASAATSTFNSLVDPRLKNVENKTYNMIPAENVLSLKTIIGGTSIELYPTGTLYLGGQVDRKSVV